MEPDLYETLQVHPTAEPDIIDAAFKRLARKYHPDANPSPDAAEVMKRITAAHEVLRDPERRAAYDRELASRRPEDLGPQAPRPQVSYQDLPQDGGIVVSLLGGLAGLGIRWGRPAPPKRNPPGPGPRRR